MSGWLQTGFSFVVFTVQEIFCCLPFGDRLHFPIEVVGRCDMSRGGLMLRCVRDRRQLTYVPVLGAVRNGKRPPRLERVDWTRTELKTVA